MLKMKDIAQRAGVSSTTVSFVLNGRCDETRISDATRTRVLCAAEEMGYRSNHLARAMRTGNSRMLGSVGGVLSEEHVGKMLAGALESADAQGYTLKIFRLNHMGENAREVIRRSSELRLMGVLALHLPVATQTELYEEARRYGYPVVLMDGRSEQADFPQVLSDDESGIHSGVEHLVKLGHKRIAFSSGEKSLGISASREQAFVAAMKKHGLAVLPEHMTYGDFRLREPSVQAARALLCLPKTRRPTAIFCSGDLIALTTLQVAHELKISVPADLSLIGFANMSVSEFATPQLTTIEQPFEEIGRAAVRILLDIVEEKTGSGSAEFPVPREAKPLRLPTRFIERASTAPPRLVRSRALAL